MTGVAKARRIKMGRARRVRTAKGIAVSVAAHILICALLGFAAIHVAKETAPEPIYDVALMGAAGAPAPAAASAPPAPVEQPKPPEEVVPPQPDDIIEEKPPEEPVQEETPKPAPPQPQMETPAPTAFPGTGGTASEGTGEGSGAAAEGSGSGETQGIPPASDAIEAPAVPPSVTAGRAPEYPYSAQRKNIEGTVVVRFLLNKDGGVDDVDVAESSGNDALDRAALEAAEGFSFSPGLDGYGRPVRCYAYQPFTFRLE
ncbi:MAG: energy transducer TonB [Schwartzia sp.]|nr:energy transducer TonB [Schwartzia sp. (in: firmicutes)]